MGIGKSIQRVDARAKVTGQAKYTQDLMTQPMMVAKVVHSTIANGVVTGFDLDEALKVPGVVKIVTCFDVPEIDFCSRSPFSDKQIYRSNRCLRVRACGCGMRLSSRTRASSSYPGSKLPTLPKKLPPAFVPIQKISSRVSGFRF